MATHALQGDALLPRPAGGLARGAGLSLLVHAGLITALTLGVGWHMRAPEVVSAELWSSVPQVAAPKLDETPAPTPAPPPPAPVVKETAPPPNEAQIATERAERKKREEAEERDKAERQKKQREADEKKKQQRDQQEAQKAEQARLDKLREEQMKRMLGTLQGSGSPNSTGSASRDAAPSTGYAARLVARIKSNLIFGDAVQGNPAAEVEVRSTPTGTIMARRLVKSSGNKDYDEAVLRAIDRTGTLPADTDGRVPATIIITFRPNE